VIDLDARLAQGPLRVRSIWSADGPEGVTRKILRRRRLLFAADLAFASACVLALVVFGLGRRAPSAAQPTALQAAEQQAVVAAPTTTFHDGSVAELVGRDTALRVEQDTPQHVVAHLTGGARFRVVPNRQRTFEVQAGPVRVRVMGTTFSVVQLPSGPAQVLVEQGHVQVAWLGGAAELQAGEGGVFPPSEARATTEVSPAPAALDDAQSMPGVTGGPTATGARAGARKGWRDYAVKGEYARAFDELNASRDGVRDEAADLMLAADVERLSGHPDQAVQPLRELCDRHANDRRAPVAAFTLGRVLLDDLGRPTEAAAAFQRARALWPRGPLAEDALAREADAWERAGRPERARSIADQYLARYPQGRHADAMRNVGAP
jgi:transmembrane sensor